MRPSARNARAINAYMKAGFKKSDKPPGYYLLDGFMPLYGAGDYGEGGDTLLVKQYDNANLTLRAIGAADIPKAIDLVWRVFSEFEASEYSQDGVDEFRHFLDDIPTNTELRMTGCWDSSVLIGLTAIRPLCHISLLFVDKAHHRKGIARLLWKSVLADESLVGGT